VQHEGSVPPAATFSAVTIFGLSGFFNVILLMKTRPSTGLFGHLMFLQPARPPVLEQIDGAEPVNKEFGRLPPESAPGR